ncbi:MULTISPECIES: GNAT family N-acetyltransferase [unclassified Ruegeria]|uniref:GNAT family N-acetyltransferase n=1 Tax=unclassified Ruegeria TaxID=2625375 RepID=UPI0014915A9D|nr:MULTISPECIES: N-acetyltransferase [unclassified Ruegeria]NOD46447.1 N-acetyltransferase [Ruegeria sp. HKCCD5849]NOD50253.1 N-acetyltransferase [Ruegeria sp. HKCCD5851]NOD67088.1 N-acetyltransferase [Ruegeria sp. HKCCD7303]
MKFSTGLADSPFNVAQFFEDVFAASEGTGEGVVIGAFVQDLIDSTPSKDLLVCTAHSESQLLGCAIFSRIMFPQDARCVFILSPMAVRTDNQKTGVGQALISYGLDCLRAAGVDVALTYGDPGYYCKTGFGQISETTAQPPLALSHPHGWLGQSLDGQDLTPLKGPSRCVPALNNPSLW